MKKIFLHIIILFICTFAIPQLYAQVQEEVYEKVEQVDAPAVETDEEDELSYNKSKEEFINKREYDRDRIAFLKKKKEFQYNDDVTDNFKREWEYSQANKNSDTLTDLSKEKSGGKDINIEPKKEKNNDNSSFEKEENNIALNINWLFIILLALGVVLLVLYFTGFKPSTFFNKHKNINEQNQFIDEDHIDNIAFETEIEKAIRLKNYRLAIRLLYLETLKKLNDDKKINWQLNKTNWDYVKEVEPIALRKDFQKITTSFDYAWYGNFNIDESTFALIQDQIKLFKQKI